MNLDIGQMTRQQKLQTMHALWEDLVQDDAAVESPEKSCTMIVRLLDSALEDLNQVKGFLRAPTGRVWHIFIP